MKKIYYCMMCKKNHKSWNSKIGFEHRIYAQNLNDKPILTLKENPSQFRDKEWDKKINKIISNKLLSETKKVGMFLKLASEYKQKTGFELPLSLYFKRKKE
jgi:hypothetical protein